VKKFLIAMTVIGAISAPVRANDVGVSVTIGQPGFYGQIDVGGFPRPALLYPQPVMIERVPVVRPPIYLRVPPGHAKHWERHCYEYNACGEQVYFVRDDWYTREYVPHYHGQRENYRDDRRDYRDDHRGHGHGHGRGRDRDE
jgi:hypothetical protein